MSLASFAVELSWDIILLATVIGVVVSTLINLTGVGGGVLVIPLLSIIFSLPPVMVIGTASLYVTLSKLFSSISHIRSGTVDWKSSIWFLFGAAPAVLVTTLGIVHLLKTSPEYNAIVQEGVYYATVSFMVLACGFMLRSAKVSRAAKEPKIALVLAGVAIGVVMGSTGVGGGVLIIPALALLTNLSMKQIISGSLIIALIVSGLTGLVYSEGGQIHAQVLTGLLVGSTVGVYVSSGFRSKIPDHVLRMGIIGLIIISAIIMLVRGAPV